MLPNLIKQLAVPALLLLCPLPGIANPVVFSAGAQGGGYWSAATRLQEVATGMDLQVQVEESPGSLQNLARLMDDGDPTSLALAQADALRHYLNEHPGHSQKIEILENVGQECVFIVTSSASEIHSDEDLQQRDYRLAISSPDSGVAVTYAFMQTLAPEMDRTSVLYMDTAAVVDGFQADDAPGADAVMLVHRPKEYSPEVDVALRNPGQLRFVEVSDKRFKGKLPNGEAVYNAARLAIPVPESEERQQVTTICVKGLLLASREKLLPEQREKLWKLVNEQWMKVYATER